MAEQFTFKCTPTHYRGNGRPSGYVTFVQTSYGAIRCEGRTLGDTLRAAAEQCDIEKLGAENNGLE